ncbi:MAG: nucleotide exchange factor GrpE [Termitinemataceae bacterium]|nr:MAG: nucleotide exchange factor GrpE [Termitinemataceae bacterium]
MQNEDLTEGVDTSKTDAGDPSQKTNDEQQGAADTEDVIYNESDSVAAANDAPAAEGDPQQKIAALEAKVAELNDLYLRKAADFENFRKRTIKDKQDAIDFANQSLLLDLIAVLDDFERAIKSAETSAKTESDFIALCEGINMIQNRLLSNLETKWSLKRFDSAGTPFDPAKHEALMMEKSADVSEAAVQEEFAKGYTLKDRVVRAAKVKVLMPE